MMGGPEPGSARYEITWTRVTNTTLIRMEDDSLIHLFTRKKTLKRRTKLLNSHLREHANQTISYPDYIKVKTAVLRTLSDDEETSDESALSDINEFKKPHVNTDNPESSDLRTLLQEMMLESPGSTDEFEEKKSRHKKIEKKRRRPRVRKNPREENSNNSDSEGHKAPAVVKRPRGRPRKLTTDPIKNKSQAVKSCKEKLGSKSLVNERDSTADDDKSEASTSNIMSVIVDHHENSNVSEINSEHDPLVHNITPIKRSNYTNHTNDVNSHIFEKISKMISNGVEPHIAADASRIYSTDDEVNGPQTSVYSTDEGEFLSPHTSDCENDTNMENPLVKVNVSGNSMNNDDVFEEEKVITESQLSMMDGTSHFNGEVHDKNELNHVDIDNKLKKSQKTPVKNILHEIQHKNIENLNVPEANGPSEFVVDDPQQEESKNKEQKKKKLQENKSVDPEEEIETVIFTQEFDAKNQDKVNHIEEDVNNIVKEFDEKFSKDNAIVRSEKLDKNKENHEFDNSKIKSTGKIPKSNRKIVQSSPKSPADVKRNLMATLDSLDNGKSMTINDKSSQITVADPPLLSLDGEDYRPDDQYSLAPADSGIDEDSETILPQEYQISKGNELDKTNEPTETTSPSKKKANLKITCTEVLKSKYMIMKKGRELKSMRKSVPQATGPSDGPKESLDEPVAEKNDELSRRYSAFEDKDCYNILPLRDQLNNYESDRDDYGASDYERNEQRSLKRRGPVSLSVASESESLQYVLNSLSAREHYVNDWCEERGDVLQQELLMRETSGCDYEAKDEKSNAILPRPTSIPEFIEGTNLVPFEDLPSFTLADIGEDEDIYLMEIPKSILEEDLAGQGFKLMDGRIIIGDGRYDIQTRDSSAMSCILHCGDSRNRYKTGIIEPVGHIIVRQQVRDDVMKTPKVELESTMSVPFPKNIKSRNPLVLTESPSDRDPMESMRMRADEEDQSRGEPTVDSRKRKLKQQKTTDDSDRINDNHVPKKRRRIFSQEEENDELDHQRSSDEISKDEEKMKEPEELSTDEESPNILLHDSEKIFQKHEEPLEELISEEFEIMRKNEESKKRRNSFRGQGYEAKIEKRKDEIPLEKANISGNSMDNDDMFEEEKVITQSQLSMVDGTSHFNGEIQDKNELNHVDIDNELKKSQTTPVKNILNKIQHKNVENLNVPEANELNESVVEDPQLEESENAEQKKKKLQKDKSVDPEEKIEPVFFTDQSRGKPTVDSKNRRLKKQKTTDDSDLMTENHVPKRRRRILIQEEENDELVYQRSWDEISKDEEKMEEPEKLSIDAESPDILLHDLKKTFQEHAEPPEELISEEFEILKKSKKSKKRRNSFRGQGYEPKIEKREDKRGVDQCIDEEFEDTKKEETSEELKELVDDQESSSIHQNPLSNKKLKGHKKHKKSKKLEHFSGEQEIAIKEDEGNQNIDDESRVCEEEKMSEDLEKLSKESISEERELPRKKKKSKKREKFSGVQDAQKNTKLSHHSISEEFEDEKSINIVQHDSDKGVKSNEEEQFNSEEFKLVKKKKKKHRKLFNEQEYLIDLQDNSHVDEQDEEKYDPFISGELTVAKKNKKSKKHKQEVKVEGSLIVPQNILKSEVKKDEVDQANTEEFQIPKRLKKSKKRRSQEKKDSSKNYDISSDNSDINVSEVEVNFKSKKRKERGSQSGRKHEDSFDGENAGRISGSEAGAKANERNNGVKIPKRSFYDQMMDDSE